MDYYLRFSAEELEKIAADCRNNPRGTDLFKRCPIEAN